MTNEYSILSKVRKVLTKDAPIELDSFVLIDVESLSLDDTFMKYTPETDVEKNLKDLITEAIITKEKNFYKSIYDPSLIIEQTDEGPIFRLSFVPNVYPAIWWSVGGFDYKLYRSSWPNKCYEMAKEYMPQYNSRIGTRLQYAAFLGIIIKELSQKVGVYRAWYYVCGNSRKLGGYNGFLSKLITSNESLTKLIGSKPLAAHHYYRDDNQLYRGDNRILTTLTGIKKPKKSSIPLFLTGKNPVFGFYDLTNTYKLLDVEYNDDPVSQSFYLASGCFNSSPYKSPIAAIKKQTNFVEKPHYWRKLNVTVENRVNDLSVPWVVLL